MRPLPLFAALGLLPATALAQEQPVASPSTLAAGTVLEVSAQGQVTRVPDVATIRAGVVTQGATAAAALILPCDDSALGVAAEPVPAPPVAAEVASA